MAGIKGLDGSKGMSPRKAIASGSDDNFGVKGLYNTKPKMHPDHSMTHAAMEDGERGIGKGIHYHDNHLPAQAAPNHGPHHMRGRK